jgi:transcriptional regulator with XRE-family HTH domain
MLLETAGAHTVERVDDNDRLGKRIAAARTSLGLTQQQLADRAKVSKSMIAKVETGAASASNQWVGAVAKALGVDIAHLTGGPNSAGPADNTAVHRLVPSVRRALASWDLADEATSDQIIDLEMVVHDVNLLHQLRHAADYARIGALLPATLANLHQLAQLGMAHKPHVYRMLTQAYRAGNTFAHKLGYVDLSLTALDRMDWAAQRAGDQVLAAVVDYVRAGALTRIGEISGAIRLLNRAIASVEPLAVDDIDARAVLGSLHMKLVAVYGAAADSDSVDTHLTEARRIAQDTGPDRRVYETVFGPANVELHALHAHNDMAQTGEAIRVAEAIQLPDGMPRERVTYYWTDRARAMLLNGNADAAVEALYEARAVAPLHFKNSKVVRGTLFSLASQERRAGRGLRALANEVGILD